MLLALGCIVLVIVPLIVTPSVTSLIVKSVKASEIKMEPFNKESSKIVVSTNENFHRGLFDVVKDAKSNQIMSSYSVSSVLSMILHGASGNTASEMRKSLGLEDEKAFEEFAKNYKGVANQLRSNENFTLNSANRCVSIYLIILCENIVTILTNHLHSQCGKSELLMSFLRIAFFDVLN